MTTNTRELMVVLEKKLSHNDYFTICQFLENHDKLDSLKTCGNNSKIILDNIPDQLINDIFQSVYLKYIEEPTK